jgi:hypothetical protein
VTSTITPAWVIPTSKTDNQLQETDQIESSSAVRIIFATPSDAPRMHRDASFFLCWVSILQSKPSTMLYQQLLLSYSNGDTNGKPCVCVWCIPTHSCRRRSWCDDVAVQPKDSFNGEKQEDSRWQSLIIIVKNCPMNMFTKLYEYKVQQIGKVNINSIINTEIYYEISYLDLYWY